MNRGVIGNNGRPRSKCQGVGGWSSARWPPGKLFALARYVSVRNTSIAMSSHLTPPCSLPPGILRGAVVLELGSGTGIVGISTALLGARVTLTDLPEAMPALLANIERNSAGIRSGGGIASACIWDWHSLGGPPTAATTRALINGAQGPDDDLELSTSSIANAARPADDVSLILGADLVYSTRQVTKVLPCLEAFHTNIYPSCCTAVPLISLSH